MTDEQDGKVRILWAEKYPWLQCEIECGAGWDGLLGRLFDLLDSHWTRSTLPEGERHSVVQVKEKFGTLRVYTEAGDDTVHGMVEMAEYASGMICERCGASPATTGGRGWVMTLCTRCRSSLDEK